MRHYWICCVQSCRVKVRNSCKSFIGYARGAQAWYDSAGKRGAGLDSGGLVLTLFPKSYHQSVFVHELVSWASRTATALRMHLFNNMSGSLWTCCTIFVKQTDRPTDRQRARQLIRPEHGAVDKRTCQVVIPSSGTKLHTRQLHRDNKMPWRKWIEL